MSRCTSDELSSAGFERFHQRRSSCGRCLDGGEVRRTHFGVFKAQQYGDKSVGLQCSIAVRRIRLRGAFVRLACTLSK